MRRIRNKYISKGVDAYTRRGKAYCFGCLGIGLIQLRKRDDLGRSAREEHRLRSGSNSLKARDIGSVHVEIARRLGDRGDQIIGISLGEDRASLQARMHRLRIHQRILPRGTCTVWSSTRITLCPAVRKARQVSRVGSAQGVGGG